MQDTVNKSVPFTYLAIFAKDPKQSIHQVKNVCKESLLLINQQYASHVGYEEQISKENTSIPLQRQPTAEELKKVQNDLLLFQNWNIPQDIYHITCLYIGDTPIKDLEQIQKLIYDTWKDNVCQPIITDFIVYVPNFLITGFTSDLGEVKCANDFAHMTLLLKGQATAVESNYILAILFEKYPEVFTKREKKITAFNVPYRDSDIMFVIDTKFIVQGVTGNNVTHGTYSQ